MALPLDLHDPDPLDERKDPDMTQRLTRALRRRQAEDRRVRDHVWAIRESAFTWDVPTAYRGLSDRTDTVTFPRIVLAGTVAG